VIGAYDRKAVYLDGIKGGLQRYSVLILRSVLMLAVHDATASHCAL